jgi:hypothetical protein
LAVFCQKVLSLAAPAIIFPNPAEASGVRLSGGLLSRILRYHHISKEPLTVKDRPAGPIRKDGSGRWRAKAGKQPPAWRPPDTKVSSGGWQRVAVSEPCRPVWALAAGFFPRTSLVRKSGRRRSAQDRSLSVQSGPTGPGEAGPAGQAAATCF